MWLDAVDLTSLSPHHRRMPIQIDAVTQKNLRPIAHHDLGRRYTQLLPPPVQRSWPDQQKYFPLLVPELGHLLLRQIMFSSDAERSSREFHLGMGVYPEDRSSQIEEQTRSVV